MIPWGSFRGRQEEKWDSFWGRFGDHSRVGDHFGVGIISGAVQITHHLTCTSAYVIYCITCTLCKKLYIGETGRQLGNRFREHLRDVEKDDKNASKPVTRHFNLSNHSMQHMAVCGLSLLQGSTESRETLEQKEIFFKSALLILTVFIQLIYSAQTNSVAPYFCI